MPAIFNFQKTFPTEKPLLKAVSNNHNIKIQKFNRFLLKSYPQLFFLLSYLF